MNAPSARLRFAPFLPVLLVASACRVVTDGAQPVTPQRPTVASDTSTTAARTWELETGVALDPGSSLDTPSVLKYGLDTQTELFVGMSPYLLIAQPGDDADGLGDLFLGLRHRLRQETAERPSTAVQLTLKLPTADDDEGLGSGKADFRVAGIVGRTFDSFSATGFYELGLLGDPGASGLDLGHTLAAGAGRSIDDVNGAFAELAGVFVPENDVERLFATVGLTHALQPNRVLDFSVVVGLNDEAPDYVLQVGLTQNFGTSARAYSKF